MSSADSFVETNEALTNANSRTRLHLVARIIVALLSVVATAVYVRALPAFYARYATLEYISVSDNARGLNYREIARANLEQIGMSSTTFAAIFVAMSVLSVAVFLTVAVIIYFHRSDNSFSLFMTLVLVLLGTSLISTGSNLGPLWTYLKSVLNGIGEALFILFFFLFPNGRFVPRWSRLPALLLAGLIVGTSFFPTSELNPINFSSTNYVLFLLLWGIFGIFAQIYRYRQVSTTVEQRQTRWVVFGAASTLLGSAIVIIAQGMLPNAEPGTWSEIVATAAATLFILFIPVSIGFAILRYRLFDIDVIIRRTLLYSILTAVLLLVYFGSVTLLQSLFSAFSGQESPIATVLSTLAIAALFSPLRKRIQELLDRRFFRRKYNARLVLAEYAALARNEVALDRLGGEMLRVVEETVQPSHVSLWLRPYDSRRGIDQAENA